MSKLVPPHGGGALKPLLLKGKELEEEKKKAKTLKTIPMTSREAGDVLMLGIGAFTPLEGFMRYDDWKGVCDACKMANGLFW
ncbi:MAG TPA: sulfate adenylyltransferase, partial [Thermodesulfobacteriota bacterium]|nr:sulfate adenylyltransferase [Thermodesulfobacteriota bacterium]